MKKYPKHEDHRGYFQELARIKDLGHDIAQVGIFTIHSGKTRGNHYHKKLVETFIVLEGKCVVTLFDESSTMDVYEMKEGDSVTMVPGVQHKFYTETYCKMLALASREFNPEDPDVFQYEG